LSLFWIQTLLVLAFVFTGFFPIEVLYLLSCVVDESGAADSAQESA